MNRITATLLANLALVGCGGSDTAAPVEETQTVGTSAVAPENIGEQTKPLGALAESFVKLALAIGQHDAAFVDAYQGPEAWAEAAVAEQRPLDMLEIDAVGLLTAINALDNAQDPRTALLRKQVVAAFTRIQMSRGETFAFNEETRLLYDAVAPEYDLNQFDAALAEIDLLLPGEGTLAERVDAFRNSLAIPDDKLQLVFDAAIAECRKRTLGNYNLPEAERFRLEFVTDKTWSGYNWYQGDFESLIQVNTDFPIIIDRAVDLGCHEGYPGHHTWNVLLEREFVKKNGWIEYSVYPLFGPLSVIAEGSANYGIELAFPEDEKTAFERDVLFPLAGIDPAQAATLDRLNKARRKLAHSRNHIAREYLDGRIDRDTAIELSMKYGLTSRERAEQGVGFIETYRGYVINYNLGRDLVHDFVGREVAKGNDPWAAFEKLLTIPVSASDLTLTLTE